LNKILLFSVCIIALAGPLSAQKMKVSTGELITIEKFETKLVEPRTIRIWLPEGYNSEKKYAVLYMHDGQNIFGDIKTWNGQTWDADGTLLQLMRQGKIRNCILVGIDNAGIYRRTDYMPQKVFNKLPFDFRKKIYSMKESNVESKFNGSVRSDNYLKFIVNELKPYIDKSYSTLSDRKNTFIAGSSFGGLISMYAICEYPEVFGGAACLSTHWTVSYELENNPAPELFASYIEENAPDPTTHKIYFDYGTETLDSLYEPCQIQIDAVMREKGFSETNWKTQKFPGYDHSEDAWRRRFHIPVEFLLGK
jgi:enterochelin esterase-like enzyme